MGRIVGGEFDSRRLLEVVRSQGVRSKSEVASGRRFASFAVRLENENTPVEVTTALRLCCDSPESRSMSTRKPPNHKLPCSHYRLTEIAGVRVSNSLCNVNSIRQGIFSEALSSETAHSDTFVWWPDRHAPSAWVRMHTASTSVY